jgi:hypothetical protein
LATLRNDNLISSIRAVSAHEGLCLGLLWAITGFLTSFGPTFFLNRTLSELFVPFRSLRMPARSAMICYVGLSVLAGIGAIQLAKAINRWQPTVSLRVVVVILAIGLAFELRATPLAIVHGAVDADAVSLRLKDLTMRGGVVELPGSNQRFPLHLAMLRAADHEKPLVNAASTFVSPYSLQIDELVKGPGIKPELLDLLEKIPASYVVYRETLTEPERLNDFAAFFKSATNSGRLRLVGVYDERVSLYLVVKTEGASPK